MITVVANQTDAVVADDKSRTFTHMTRKEAQAFVKWKVHNWKDSVHTYGADEFYLSIGYKEEKRDGIQEV